ncbi:MAG: ATP-binding protein [Bacteroidia bacterium]|nr:ATP-binding protein [Bacteroidia bacterium]
MGLIIGGIGVAGAVTWALYERYRYRRLESRISEVVGSPAWEAAIQSLLHRLNQQEAASHAQQAFLAALSHELKTPLAILLGYLDTLVQGAWQDQQVLVPFLEKSLAQVQRMNSLVQDILLLAQIESGGWLIQPEPTPLYPLLEEVWAELEPLARAKAISLRRPPYHLQDLAVEADPYALRKILKNLLENAIQYSLEGRTIQVSWELTPDKKRVMIHIQDEGIGIPPEHLPRIFERFYRVDKSRSRQHGGTGLGLSLVKELIEAHGQRITVESEVGRGTRFTFSLPSCA